MIRWDDLVVKSFGVSDVFLCVFNALLALD